MLLDRRLKLNLQKIKSKARFVNRIVLKKAVIWHLAVLKRIHGSSPVSLNYWIAVRNLLHHAGMRESDLLFPPYELLRSHGTLLNISELRVLLANETLGLWALDAETIAVLWDSLWRDRPRVILECGAGVSTLVLAIYAVLASERLGDHHFVFSLEQDLQIKERVEEKLKENHLDDWVQIIHAPLDDKGMYNLDGLRKALLAGPQIDWILIDGPSGPPRCRFNTLPALVGFCRVRATWFLDDAFRDAELRILREWRNMPRISVEGIYPVGKGLARGYVS